MQLRTVLSVLLITAGSAIAGPPGCFLAAINTQDNPADVKSICQNKASDVQKAIPSVCSGSDVNLAYSALADTCKSQGVTVPTPSGASSSASGTSKVELYSNQQPISPENSESPPTSNPNPNPEPNPNPISNISTESRGNDSKASSIPGKTSQTSTSTASSSTNLLNSGTDKSSSSSATGTGTSKLANAGAQLTGFGTTGVLGVVVAGVIGGTVLIL